MCSAPHGPDRSMSRSRVVCARKARMEVKDAKEGEEET